MGGRGDRHRDRSPDGKEDDKNGTCKEKRIITQYDRLRHVLECPVCLERPARPIYQCLNGHLICWLCYFQVEKCPVCRKNLDLSEPIRNLTAEYLADDVRS